MSDYSQARTIISMANQGNVTDQQQRQVVREDHDHHCHQADSGSASTAAQQLNPAVAAVADDRHVPPPAVAPPPRQDHLEAAASGLSMKRSLQRFLEKRKARAAAAAPLYPGERPVARR
uniref:Uncharacterized protein n=1 Tax=Oryza brachyantha TaxID=4533 RepID=J3MIM2_ORYBR